MKGNQVSKNFIIPILIVALLLASFALGCGSQEKQPLQSGALSNARLLPESSTEPVASVNSGTSYINVLSATTSVDFPKSLTFDLEVESSPEVSDIELQYKIKKVTTSEVTTIIKPDFSPANRVEASWTWNTRKFSLPPGAEVEYEWVIKNAAGDELETKPAILTFNDSRYDWQELTEGNIRLFWYKGGQSFGQDLMQAAQTALKKLDHDTGATLDTTAKIYIYASTQELQGALIFPQEWTGGEAFPDYSIITIGISPKNLGWGKKVIAHELSHLVIHQITFNPYGGLPTWLDEGLAMYAEGELDAYFKDLLKNAVSNDSLFHVRTLISSFPADPREAALAYAQSYSLVSFLINSYGSQKMLELLHVFKKGESCDDALLKVYEFDTDGLETRWRDNLGSSSHIEGKLGTDPFNLPLATLGIDAPGQTGTLS